MKEEKPQKKKHGSYAVFLDIDGTLLSGGVLNEKNAKAIAKAQANGHKFLLNTGRSFAFIPWEALSGIRFDGICAGCGCYVKIDGEVLRSVALEPEFVASVVDMYKKSGRCLFMEGEQACFWVNPQKRDSANKMLSAAKFPCFAVSDGAEFLQKYKDYRISKLTFWGTGFPAEDKALWEEKLRVIEHPAYAESVIYGCDKALGMKIALEAMNIPIERSIAMGDSANDTEMLEYAGISVAMGNATAQVKEMCDLVSCDASEAGVAYAIEKLLPEEK